jgi:hypothetical protein
MVYLAHVRPGACQIPLGGGVALATALGGVRGFYSPEFASRSYGFDRQTTRAVSCAARRESRRRCSTDRPGLTEDGKGLTHETLRNCGPFALEVDRGLLGVLTRSVIM